MIGKNKKFYCIVFIFLCSICAFGQDFENGIAPFAIITRQSNVRAEPTKKSAKLQSLDADSEIRVIDETPKNGYFRVLFGDGEEGYVYYKNVNVESSEEFFKLKEIDDILAVSAPDEPCIRTGFETCPTRGCYQPNTPGAFFNEAKRRSPVGRTPVTISFAELEQMQNEIGNRLGLRSQNKALSAAERERLKDIRVTNGIVGESTLVKIVGFIPAVGEGLKEGSVETVNCKFREDNQKDIHIPLTARFSLTEFEGIVIEMIPQNRPAGWTLQKLKNIRRDKRKVMVLGGLFYDNEHLVNKNPARSLPGHSKRFTIWEIHPVTQFFVCNRVNNSCNETNMSGWIPLENFQ